MLSEINCPFTESSAGPTLRPALRSTSSTQLGLPMLASGDFVPGLSGTAGQHLRGPSFRNQSSVENFCEERPPISGRLKLTPYLPSKQVANLFFHGEKGPRYLRFLHISTVLQRKLSKTPGRLETRNAVGR